MYEIETHEKIQEKLQTAKTKTFIYGAIAFILVICVLFSMVISIDNNHTHSYYNGIILISLMLSLTICAITSAHYGNIVDMYSISCGPHKLNKIVTKLQGYQDLQDGFKKSYNRGYLLVTEYDYLCNEIRHREAYKKKNQIQQSIQDKINHWE